MLTTRCLSRATIRAPHAPRTCRNIATRPQGPRVRAAAHPYAQRRQQHFVRSVSTVTALWATASAYQYVNGNVVGEVHAEEQKDEEEVMKFEAPRRKTKSTDDNRNIISSQHLQVQRSWENPGVYAWGSNAGKTVAPDSDEKYIKTPRRIKFFDGKLLRAIKLDRNFGAAIDEKGDLLQWGTDFSKEAKEPTPTLRGKNLTSLAISRDRIIALSSNGSVYSIPVSQTEQQEGPKPASTSWISFWGGSNDVSYRTRTPENLAWSEKVVDVKSGLEHALLLTSAGRVFSFASGTQNFPSKGQLGIPGLTWESRPKGPMDIPHEITTLKGFPISKIATGDYHSLVCDSAGRAFSFGDNTSGQLGFPFNSEAPHVDAPSLLPTQKLYAGTAQQGKVTNVFAGGNTSYLTAEASKPNESRITADTFAFGHGLTGQLGVGRWIHTQPDPTRIPTFSGLFEWDETANTVIPIKLHNISVGSTHAAAIMDNVASVVTATKSRKLTENDTNWGRDILFWGNNEFYQIGSGKRSNVATPTYIQPLDQQAENERAASASMVGKLREKEMHRFQISPRAKVKVNGRTVEIEQKVECGRGVTAVYSAV
ncbi:mitochondrial protein-like protein Fmp25 [Macroventuria anomochaeta]|uniref:Mitochondrial protein-like protein Fmp25 n=1 Tax=Macroventuria anomochaeta TaxID=301207 RepID=A0ACB6S7S0_9PLEO|nr:mitochondrial protein-like protein Fmp25 [Macroventuria anomochaeta]KAF2630047.1 mitochondrial protein-like protein Fmp25 [Macroventuria anomochaeta]